ncbi:MAG: hypothetical protein NC418_00770 [Muribaculaceae bacterium]|nr:hypothetical protein [Muribaculaceae bacterium]
MKKLIQARNEEFKRRCLEIFRRDYDSGTIRPLDSVIERALAMQPRSHYLSFDTASRRLHRIERRGLEAEVHEELARLMWAEVMAQVRQAMERRGTESFDRALSFVLNFCRPSRFYMSFDTARRLLTPHLSYSLTRNRC